jgi:hypothetical protein
MRGCRKALGVSLAAVAALSSRGNAWAQEAGQPPGAPLAAGAPALSDERLDARLVALVDEMAPVQLGTVWEGVVSTALERMEQLPQAAAPAVTGDTPEPRTRDLLALPRPDVMTDEVGPAERAPEAGPTFELGPFQLTLAPIVASSPVVANVRGGEAILLGITLRAPWMIP